MNISEFQHVRMILPERDLSGNILQTKPAEYYANSDGLKLNKYGDGYFCKFTIDSRWNNIEGVYLFLENMDVLYVGETVDFGKRFNSGYGNISPRNCYIGGQPTNCRINNLVLQKLLNDSIIEIRFLETTNRIYIEREIIKKLDPPWNISRGKSLTDGLPKRRVECFTDKQKIGKKVGKMNKYGPLEDYFKAQKLSTIRLTFKEIEEIIGSDLPMSAKKYSAWWSNDKTYSHPQANAWLFSGWEVNGMSLGEWVEFKRMI